MEYKKFISLSCLEREHEACEVLECGCYCHGDKNDDEEDDEENDLA